MDTRKCPTELDGGGYDRDMDSHNLRYGMWTRHKNLRDVRGLVLHFDTRISALSAKQDAGVASSFLVF